MPYSLWNGHLLRMISIIDDFNRPIRRLDTELQWASHLTPNNSLLSVSKNEEAQAAFFGVFAIGCHMYK